MKRIIDKETHIFIRDDFAHDEVTEIALDVQPAQGLYLPKWDLETEEWIEAGQAPEPVTPVPTVEERLEMTEKAILALMME